LEIWGQWIRGDQTSEKFPLKYAGSPSLFEGKMPVLGNGEEVRLQIIAADQAGNFGQHTILYRIAP